MKPLNLDNKPCSPTSSNCVIWSGRNLPCINLCTGDTVTDVIEKLATELCTIMDQLDISNYDLRCFNITACPPSTFAELLQFLIEQICASQGVSTTGKDLTSGCPDCVVQMADCFITGPQTTMQLVDYVNLIASRVCSIGQTIITMQDQITNLIAVTEDLQFQIDNLPVYELPTVTITCNIGSYLAGSIVPLDNLLQEFINIVWCPYVTATGTTGELLSAVAKKCIRDGTLQLSNGLPFSSNGDWIQDSNYNTVADAINNLWVVLCDMFTYLDTELPVVVVDGGDGINVTSVTVGNTTTYTVTEDPKPGLYVLVRPTNLLKTTPSITSGRLCDGQIQIMPIAGLGYNDFGTAYNPTTGIWTCPETGIYELGFFVSYMREVDDGWYDAAAVTIDVPFPLAGPITETFSYGKFIAGITSPAGCDYYCVNNNSSTVTEKHVSINGSIVRPIPLNTQICLKVINLTNFDYTSTSGDIVTLSIQRVK
jgi:hypothetical protein